MMHIQLAWGGSGVQQARFSTVDWSLVTGIGVAAEWTRDQECFP